MTYDVLEKVRKKDLIAWMRKNIFLPRGISDEEFLRQVELDRLFSEERELLDKNDALNEKLQAATGNQTEFMRLWIESEKLNEKLNDINKQIERHMKRGSNK